MSTSRKVKYRSDLFSYLASEEHVHQAINEFGAVLNSNNYHHVLEDILSQPSVLELVLSNISPEIPLSEWMVANFPSSPDLFLDSFPSKVLDRLSTFFLLQYPQAIQPSGFANESAKFLNQAPHVLRALFAMAFVEEMRSPTTPSRPQLSTKTKANSQRYQKQLKKLSANVQHEDILFKASITIPQTKSESMEIAASILTRLCAIYEIYLNAIRLPEISRSIRESCITVDAPFPLTVVTHSVPTHQFDSAPVAPTNETAPAPLLHLKLSQYYDTPDGFGEWNILLSSRADRALRDYHRTNPRTYEIIRRKINDLSNGHFSYDNQKRLNGPKTDIPIYEAKMTGDLRLVYVIDCITSPTDSQREMQALKVFDFCTHAKMDHRLWDSVASHLQSQGKEYRSRCLKRQRRTGDSGDVYVPASFPLREEEQEESSTSDMFIEDLVRQDNNELHSIITLEKYVALSKDLLESIEADHEGAFPFELSRYERKIAEYPTSCYVLGRSGTGKTTTMLHKMLWVQRAYQHHTANTQRPRQVFVTRSSVLARKVEEHFSTYMAAGRIDGLRNRFAQSTSNDLVNQSGHSAWRESNMTFKGLSDDDFPLFIPLEDLYYLLEGDIDWNGKLPVALGPRFRPLAKYKGKLVSFHRFLGEYWPTFSKRLTNPMNPALVFNEIIGVISGSERTLGSEHGHLSREQYLDPESSRAASSNFTQEQWGIIYDIFVLYLKLKHEKDDYDISDRSRTIITAFQHKALPVRKIDHLYVDETQDNLLIDALVLRLLCRNPNGLFWAGDTAQTISAGSAFRFNELKAFMHRIEERRLKQETKGNLVKQISHIPPHVFQLATNFRSHAGIVDCAHIVVELIKKYFPHTIDMLKRERGVVEGAKPMFCSDFDPDQFKEGGILSSSNMNGDRIELGAQQCILVRDDAARERFLEEIGDIGLVVTLYDSKGLEFNDVILLNFFEDSNLTRDQWSVVLNVAPGQPYAPKFDLMKHTAICLELKSLYVAITRARNNLRVVDCSDKSEPMKVLWEKLGCITQATFQEAFKNFAVQSSREDWIKRAKELFDQEKYALSRDAYLRGQSYRNAAVAAAYYERECAQRTPSQVGHNRSNLRSERFNKAAEAFVRCADEAEGEYGRKKYHNIVADCYEEAGALPKAVDFYRLAGNFTRVALLLRKQGLFDEVKDIMMAHGNDIEPTVLQNLKDVARLYFVKSKDYSKVHELFDTPEDEIEYLEDRNLDLAQVDLYLHHGRITEAADIHLADGRFNEAASLLINDKGGGTTSLLRAVNAIIQGLRTYATFGSDLSSNSNAAQLLVLSKNIPLETWASDESHREEITMYRYLHNHDVDHLYDMVDGLVTRSNVQAALLILDYIFTTLPDIPELFEVAKVARILTYFSRYVELLHEAAFFADPTLEKNQKLFGVVQHDADTFSFQPTSLIAAFRANNAAHDNLRTMKKVELVATFRRCLQERLRQKVVDENLSCRRAPVFDPCLRHVALGDCKQSVGQCHRPHITTDEIWFRDWLRIHLLQIFIYTSIRRIEKPTEVTEEQIFWLKKFHEAINPPHHAMGSLSCITTEFLQEMSKQFSTITNLIREITFRLDIDHPASFLTVAMLSSDLAFIFDRKDASVYIYRAKFVQEDVLHPIFIRQPSGQNSLQELLLAFQGKGVDSLEMGVLFIRHVVDKKLKININVFCTFIEKICGLIVVYNTFTFSHGFHNIMLPRSWLKRIMSDFDGPDALNKNKDCYGFLLQPLHALVVRLYFGGDPSNHLLYGPRYTNIPNGIRKVYIARICRVLGLLGHNIKVNWLREDILKNFKSLSASQHWGFSRLYSPYIQSNDFYDVSVATRRSMIGSSMDEMVLVKDTARLVGSQAPILGVRHILYSTEKDLAAALGLSGTPSAIDKLNGHDLHSSDIPHVSDHDEMEGSGHRVEVEPVNIAPRNADHEPKTQIPDDFYTTNTEEEMLKACVIQRAYRRIQGRKELRESSGLIGRTYRSFETCLRSLDEEKMDRMKRTRQYRFRYLAALPPLLASIDIIYDQLVAVKAKVRHQLPRLKNEALEDLSERYNLLTENIKAVNKFRGMFGPESSLHQRSDVEELRIQLQLLQGVLRNRKFPISIAKDVAESLELVHRVVFRKPSKPTAKAPKRPKLVVDDDEQLTYEDIVGSWESDGL